MPRKKSTRYTEEFKKTIVNLHQNGKSYFTYLRAGCRFYYLCAIMDLFSVMIQ